MQYKYKIPYLIFVEKVDYNKIIINTILKVFSFWKTAISINSLSVNFYNISYFNIFFLIHFYSLRCFSFLYRYVYDGYVKNLLLKERLIYNSVIILKTIEVFYIKIYMYICIIKYDVIFFTVYIFISHHVIFFHNTVIFFFNRFFN